jgi:uncharacterized protein
MLIQVKMGDKLFINAEKLYRDSFNLGVQIAKSNFKPDVLAAIWRGGTPIGCVVHEALEYKGIPTVHFPVKTSGYDGEERKRKVNVDGTEALLRNLNSNLSLLIVDDIFDTGLSIDALINHIYQWSSPREIKVATVFYKPAKNQTSRVPDFYVQETDRWIVLPHEIVGLSYEEICDSKGREVADLLKSIKIS